MEHLKLIIALLISLAFTKQSNISSSNIPSTKIYEIELAMKQHMQEHDTPALSVVVVKDGQSTFINMGTYDRTTDRKVDEHSIYQIASLSKTFTAIIINNLIQGGVINPSHSISSYLPNHYLQKTLNKYSSVTIRDLLHHRSGIRRDSKILLKIRKGNGDFQYNYTAEDFDNELIKGVLTRKPGKYMYSNFGYALLGYIAELSTNKTYEELLTQYVTSPSIMPSTSSEIKDHDKLVTAYRKDQKQTIIKPMIMGKLTPPSGLFTSTHDLAKMMIRQIDDYNNNIDSPLILSSDAIVHHEESKSRYGYGFRIFGDSGAMGHGGEMDGYASFYSIKPKANWGHSILSSSNGDELVNLWRKIYQILDTGTNN